MRTITRSALAAILLFSPLFPIGGAFGQAQPSPLDSEHTRWIMASLKEMQTIKVGMTRAELLKVFTIEGGRFTRRQRRYVYRDCPYIKVDVVFAPADDGAAESPGDKIARISQPFLEWMIWD